MIRGTLIRDQNHPKNANTCWATGPTKPYSFLPSWKKEKDSKKPNTRPTYLVRPVRTPLKPAG